MNAAHRLVMTTLACLPLLAPAKPAAACSCALEADRVVMPMSGEAGLPTDGAIWTFGLFQTIERLSLDERDLAPETVLTLPDGVLRRWPTGPLEPNHRYVVRIEDCPSEVCESLDYVTGDGTPRPAPAVPEITGVTWQEEGGGFFGGTSSCGESAFFRVRVASEPGVIVLLALGGAGAELDEAVMAEVVASPDGRTELFVGQVPCGPDVWDFDEDDEAPLRVAALDSAGGFSGWSRRQVVEAPGCQGGSRADGGLVASGAVLAWLAISRCRTLRTGDRACLRSSSDR